MPGTNYAWSKAGNLFHSTNTPLGLAIPIYTATAIAGGMPIWNPPDSGVDVELVSVDINRASGTADFGALCVLARQLTAIATGAIMTAMAFTTPFNGNLFGGRASKVKSSNAGTCTVTAGAATDVAMNIGCINLEADTGTAHPATGFTYNFDGKLIVPPGVLVYLACTKASVALFGTTISWLEIDR